MHTIQQQQQLRPSPCSTTQHITKRTQRNANQLQLSDPQLAACAQHFVSPHLLSKARQSKARQLAAANMGIPYSKQINAAFDQVTPLVSAGFEVLQTTKNISILLAAIQVVTVIILGAILLTLLALLISVNPDLEAERAAIVTPVVKWCACWAMPKCEARGRMLVSMIVLVGVVFVGSWVWFSVVTDVKDVAAEEAVDGGEGKGEGEEAKVKGEGETKA
ncbi:hypothetical protein Q7P36_002229 [Cladosporium allicinum]